MKTRIWQPLKLRRVGLKTTLGNMLRKNTKGGTKLPSIELGTFIVFLIVPFISLLFVKALKSWGWFGNIIAGGVALLGFITIGTMALFMFSEYNVVISKDIPAVNATEIQRNATGSIVLNSTVTTSGYTEENPIINDYHYEFGWIFFALAFVFGILVVKVMWVP